MNGATHFNRPRYLWIYITGVTACGVNADSRVK